MKLFKLGMLLSLLTLSTVTFASNSEAEMEAEKLLSTMNMESAMSESMSNMIDLQIKQSPSLAPLKPTLVAFFEKHMSWKSLKPEFIKIYASEFTAAELKDINAFYSTKTGKKTAALMPTLMARGAQVGSERVQANIGELQTMIMSEMTRIKQESQQAN